MARKPKRVLIIISIAVLILLTGCSANLKDVNVNIGLMNTSGEPYNVWVGHDVEVKPESVIEPAGLRWWTATVKANLDSNNENTGMLNDQVKVNVGKNGQKIKTETVKINGKYTKGMSLYIKWNGSSFEVSY